MADHQDTVFRGPSTPEAFLADRQRFWEGWTHFTLGSLIFIILLLIFMAVFLV